MAESSTMDEMAAKNAVLAWCRANEGAMRQAPENPVPGHEWGTRYRVVPLGAWCCHEPIAEGNTWQEVLAALNKRGGA